MFLLNFNSDSTAQWQGQEIMVDYMNANIFSLGRDQQNMLESIDIICLNSWGSGIVIIMKVSFVYWIH